MARRKDLTALAALGTLGYMLSKRGDKKDEKQTSDAAERRIAADKVASAIPENLDVNRNLDDELYSDTGSKKGRGAAGTSETVSAPSRASADASKKPAASSGKPSPAKPSSKTPAYVQSYTDEMMEADNPRSVKAEKAPAAASTSAAKPATAAKLSSSSRVPTSEQAAANRSAAMDKIKGVGSSIGDYFGSLDSTARYMKKKPGGLDQGSGGEYRRGGKVKKMASGGMTSSASKRADGIATKGKTRGRMC